MAAPEGRPSGAVARTRDSRRSAAVSSALRRVSGSCPASCEAQAAQRRRRLGGVGTHAARDQEQVMRRTGVYSGVSAVLAAWTASQGQVVVGLDEGGPPIVRVYDPYNPA